MAYDGLIGKIGKDIFEGAGVGLQGAALYAGIGAGVGAVGGAITTEDSIGAGALRGAVLGAGVGAGANLLPKFVQKTLNETAWRSYDGTTKQLVSDLASSYNDVYRTVNNPANKTLMKDFSNSARKHAFKSKGDFTYNTSKDILQRVGQGTGDELNTLTDLARNSWNGTESALGKTSVKNALNFYDTNKAIWNNLEGTDKWKVGAAVGLKSAFDSVIHHVVKPTGQLLKGNVNFETGTAAAVSAFGVYEGYNMLHDGSSGNYSSAFASAVGFAGLKLGYSQGMNIRSIDKILKEKNMTWGGVAKAGIGGYGSTRFAKGFSKLTPEQIADLSSLNTNAATAMQKAQANRANQQELVIGPNMQARINSQAKAFEKMTQESNTLMMFDKTISSKNTSVINSQKEMLHGVLLDSANVSWGSHLTSSAIMFGGTGMLMGGISSDSTMLEGLAWGSAGGLVKGGGLKLASDLYAKGAVNNKTATMIDKKYQVNKDNSSSSYFNTRNFIGG